MAGWDPLRIVIDVRGTGCTGYEVAAALRGHYDIHVELATHATMVLVLGLDEPAGALERFAHDFEQTVRRIERPGEQPALVRGSGWFDNEVVVPPREAFLGAPRPSPSTRPRAASRPSRSPATRPASRRCCRASGSRAELGRLPARAARRRRAPARRQRPGVQDHLRPAGMTTDELIDRALAEDVGAGDVTTEATVDAAARGRARRSPRRRRA